MNEMVGLGFGYQIDPFALVEVELFPFGIAKLVGPDKEQW